VFEEIDALPNSERQLSIHDRNGEMSVRQSGPYMRRHIVGAFLAVSVAFGVFRGDGCEKMFKIGPNFGGGILLDQERSGRVTAKQRQQPDADRLIGLPRGDVPRNLHEAATGGLNAKNAGRLTQGAGTFPG